MGRHRQKRAGHTSWDRTEARPWPADILNTLRRNVPIAPRRHVRSVKHGNGIPTVRHVEQEREQRASATRQLAVLRTLTSESEHWGLTPYGLVHCVPGSGPCESSEMIGSRAKRFRVNEPIVPSLHHRILLRCDVDDDDPGTRSNETDLIPKRRWRLRRT